ncbi:uncharacterized protein LOC117753423 [Hippoglossus hippoglossus]|uniref:uncharacterized protein LOC117753423 n=1 Tax=Hippoglossus hippoglossus TaxID=8267 RepID=UPI00148E034D|nr:uncharacterized protein LOC117753423 [Hippoglossus hippoglossus]
MRQTGSLPIISYDREQLLLIGLMVKNTFSPPPANKGEYPWRCLPVVPGARRRRRKRGSRAGVLVRLRKRENRPPLPSILLTETWLGTTEWCVFQDDDINTYMDAVICYISKCIDDVVPRITVRTFPNQKPWINGDVHAKLKARTDAYISGDLEEYRKSRYALRSAISSAKRFYRDKVESHYKGSNTRNMWAGLKTISDYKAKTSSADVVSASLPEDLNTFYACFESNSPSVEIQEAQEDRCPPVISRADVWRSFNRINTRKAPGPDGIPGRALKVCADQLADVFTDIFNLSLLQSVGVGTPTLGTPDLNHNHPVY